MIDDFKSIQILPDFVFFGMDQFEGVTRFEPFTFSSNEFLELQRNEEDTPLIGQMKLGNNYIHLNSVYLFIFFF